MDFFTARTAMQTKANVAVRIQRPTYADLIVGRINAITYRMKDDQIIEQAEIIQRDVNSIVVVDMKEVTPLWEK